MAHAVLLQVTLSGNEEQDDKVLHEVVVPAAKAQPGFLKGMWMHKDRQTGAGVVLFDTKEHADAAEKAIQPPPGGPTVISSGVFEIAAEA